MTITLDLGELTPQTTPKYLTIPKMSAKLAVALDTGDAITDDLVKKEFERSGKAALLKKIKAHYRRLESLCAVADQVVEKKFNTFLKAFNVQRGAKSVTPEQKKGHDAFLENVSDYVEKLEMRMNREIEKINKSASTEWIKEIHEACVEKVEALIQKKAKSAKWRRLKRSWRGRAKIVFLGTVAIVASSMLIAGAVMSFGTVPAVIAVIGLGLSIIAVCGKTAIALRKTCDKLKRSVVKLEKDAKAVEKAVNFAQKTPTKKSLDAKLLKAAGLSMRDWNTHVGADKMNSKTMYKALAGKRRLFKDFDKHFKDVEAYGMKVVAGFRLLSKKNAELQGEWDKLSQSLRQAGQNGTLDSKTLARKLKQGSQIEERIHLNTRILEDKASQIEDLNTLLRDCEKIRDNIDDLGIVASNIARSLPTMQQMAGFFSDLESFGKNVNYAGKALKDIQAD